MVIINAYLGAGSGSAIPVGKCQLDILWVPNDSQNLNNATVTITGTASYTARTDASGYASVLVNAGTYTVNVTPASGSYKVTAVSNVVAESGTVKPVAVFGQGPRRVTFRSGTSTISSASWSVKKGSTVVASGSGWTETKTADLLDDTYTFSVTAFGITKTQNFTSSATNSVIDVSGCFTKVTISGASALTITSTFAGTSVGTGRTQYCVRGSTALAYTGTVSQKIDNQVIATVSNPTFTPSAASVTVTLTVTGKPILITATKTVNIPVKANYKILVIGGGGGAGNDYERAAGGHGGVYAVATKSVAAGDYTVTIGAGGALRSAGGATSFGSVLSAAGGAAGHGYSEGVANSACGSGYTFSQSSHRYEYWGGDGIGGASGSGYSRTGQDGAALANTDGFYTQMGSSYAKGTGTYGGGGGLGAKGGNSGTISGSFPSGSYKSSCGGGGGLAGGDGGNGSNITPSSYTQKGYAGKGYGAGGGGVGYREEDGDEYSEWYNYVGGGGGGGGLYNVNNGQSQAGKSGACQIMWVS